MKESRTFSELYLLNSPNPQFIPFKIPGSLSEPLLGHAWLLKIVLELVVLYLLFYILNSLRMGIIPFWSLCLSEHLLKEQVLLKVCWMLTNGIQLFYNSARPLISNGRIWTNSWSRSLVSLGHKNWIWSFFSLEGKNLAVASVVSTVSQRKFLKTHRNCRLSHELCELLTL